MDIAITQLRGVGTVRGASFEKLGIATASQLLTLWPRRYEDIGNIIDISALSSNRGNKVTLYVKVCGVVSETRLRGSKLLTSVPVCDDSGAILISYFNNKFVKNSFRRGQYYYLYGKVTDSGVPTLYNPEVFRVIDKDSALLPVYPLAKDLSQTLVRSCVAQALEQVRCEEPLPDEILQSYRLEGIESAVYKVHKPHDMNDVIVARRRLIFEELLYFSLGLRLMRGREKSRAQVVLCGKIGDEYLNSHDFLPTSAQCRALDDIYRDLKSGFAMHRLLQGDVGSGKTLVGGQCAYCVIKSGAQAAVMAPTEVLANQHYAYFKKVMEPLGISCTLLTSSVSARDKKSIKAKIKSGEISLIIGTHAILQNDVEFCNLGLVITDEQHRFGVLQRTALSRKGSGVHVLAMSATPIPRSLALMMWGDMDLSVIDAPPAGRQKIKTFLVNFSYRQRLYGFIKSLIDDGGQVYFVCPMIDEDAQSGLSDAKTRYYELSAQFGGETCALVHGKMSSAQKDKAMTDFADGRVKILVSTTVIEVGINVPAATLMVIENAERFGLSQLHQLRGRVGRGSCQSYCILISDTDKPAASERLTYFAKTYDGFEIANKDLELRGPGNFFGSEQHGMPKLRIASANDDLELFKNASQCAGLLIEKSAELDEYPALKANVLRLFETCKDD